MKKTYDLNVKKVLLLEAFLVLCITWLIDVVFFQPEEILTDRDSLSFFYRYGMTVDSVIIIGGILIMLAVIYNLELLLYKRKNVLVLEETGITYYAPEFGKRKVEKENIQNIYFTGSELKIKLKQPKDIGIRAKFWNFLKESFYSGISEDVFRVNLQFIKCNVDEVQESIMKMNLDRGSEEARRIIDEVVKKYDLYGVEAIKENEAALIECIMGLYHLDQLSQKEIAFFIKSSTSKVSKIIRKHI